MNLLIIPSAKLIDTTLQEQFGKIPTALIPVDGKTALEYIYLEYQKFFDQIVVCGCEEVEKIEKVVSNEKFPKIELVKLSKVKSIADTVKTVLECFDIGKVTSISVNFADTLIRNFSQDYLKTSTLAYGKVLESERWTVFEISETLNFVDKKELESEELFNAVIGFFSFSNPGLFYEELNRSLVENSSNEEPLYKAVARYHSKIPFYFMQTNDWLDFGHLDNYISVKKDVESRFFNTLDIDRRKGVITKTSQEKAKFLNEIKWYLKLPEELQWLAPRIFEYSLRYEQPFIKMEYYSYTTLHDVYIYGNCSLNRWNVIFDTLLDVQKDFARYSLELDASQRENIVDQLYVTKTKQRLKSLEESSLFKPFFNNSFYVNDVEQSSLKKFLDNLDTVVTEIGLYDISSLSIIHGDFFFANILYEVNSNIVRLIDPRGDFGGYGIYGDSRYDVAKLSHSVDGMYDFIIEDLFELEASERSISYSIKCDPIHIKIKKLYYKRFTSKEIQIIKFIQSLLFLSMIPLHADFPKRQLVMLGTGMRLFNEAIEKGIRNDS